MLLLLVAFVCFIIGAIGVPVSRVNVTALGLAFWVASLLLGALR